VPGPAGFIHALVKEHPKNRHPLLSNGGQLKLQQLYSIASIANSGVNTSYEKFKNINQNFYRATYH
jgi:hypothetical protein